MFSRNGLSLLNFAFDDKLLKFNQFPQFIKTFANNCRNWVLDKKKKKGWVEVLRAAQMDVLNFIKCNQETFALPTIDRWDCKQNKTNMKLMS